MGEIFSSQSPLAKKSLDLVGYFWWDSDLNGRKPVLTESTSLVLQVDPAG